jgi:hypothetical protein
MSHVAASWASSPGPSRRVCRLPKRQSGQRLSPRRPRAAMRAADLSRRVVVADRIARMRSPRPEVGRGRSLLDRRTDQPMAAITHLSIARWIALLVRPCKRKVRQWRFCYAHALGRHKILCLPAPVMFITDTPHQRPRRSAAAMTRRAVAARPVPHDPVTDPSEHHQDKCSCLVLIPALRQTGAKPESESRWADARVQHQKPRRAARQIWRAL